RKANGDSPGRGATAINGGAAPTAPGGGAATTTGGGGGGRVDASCAEMTPFLTRRLVSWSRVVMPAASLAVMVRFLISSWTSGSLACAIAPEAAVTNASADTVAKTPLNRRIEFPPCYASRIKIEKRTPVKLIKAILRRRTKPSQKTGERAKAHPCGTKGTIVL